MIAQKLKKFFSKVHFLNVATCSNNRPNAAPKYLIRVEDDKMFFADYVKGTTWNNLKENSFVSILSL